MLSLAKMLLSSPCHKKSQEIAGEMTSEEGVVIIIPQAINLLQHMLDPSLYVFLLTSSFPSSLSSAVSYANRFKMV